MIKQNIIFIIFLTFGMSAFTQSDINQFDEDGKRHGVWKKNFENTRSLRYVGQFEHGKEVGLFKYYQKIGRTSKLAATKEFNENDNSAYVKFVSLSGKTISEGKMKGKDYVGKWTYYHKNSEKIMTIENYSDHGQLHGVKTVFYSNQQISEEVNYQNGKKEGKETHYAPTGVAVKVYNYVEDQLHGEAKHYDERGKLTIEGQYKKNKKTGIWKYYKNGEYMDQKDFTYDPNFKGKQ